MIRSFFRFILGWGPTLAALAITALIYTTMNWPASWWFRDVTVFVHDAVEGEPVPMTVVRDIRRPFIARWSVIVRRETGGSWQAICTANGFGDYIPGATLPEPLTLEWWTEGQCSTPPPGRLYITTVWRISAPGGDRPVIATSNIFEITPEDHLRLELPPISEF